MTKEEMVTDLGKMIDAFNVPLTRSGLPEGYLTLPENVMTHKYELVRTAYKWSLKIYKEQYSAWLAVWKEEPEAVWTRRELLGGNQFHEVKVLRALAHSLRKELTRRSTKPQLLRKGYKKQHEQSTKSD